MYHYFKQQFSQEGQHFQHGEYEETYQLVAPLPKYTIHSEGQYPLPGLLDCSLHKQF